MSFVCSAIRPSLGRQTVNLLPEAQRMGFRIVSSILIAHQNSFFKKSELKCALKRMSCHRKLFQSVPDISYNTGNSSKMCFKVYGC